MTSNKNPGRLDNHDRGEKKDCSNLNLPDQESQDIQQQAAELAEILIDLYRQYPLFLHEPLSDDPDLDMESGFASFGKREVVI